MKDLVPGYSQGQPHQSRNFVPTIRGSRRMAFNTRLLGESRVPTYRDLAGVRANV